MMVLPNSLGHSYKKRSTKYVAKGELERILKNFTYEQNGKKAKNHTLQNVEKWFLETRESIEQSMKNVYEREHITVEEVISFVLFVYMIYFYT